MRGLFALARLVVAFSVVVMVTGQELPVADEDMHVSYFEPLLYPLAAKLAHVQGTVVVRLQLDDRGKVSAANGVAGSKSLLSECVINARKWTFRPNGAKSVILVYNFKIQGLCQLPCASQFSFYPPNFVEVTIGNPVADHSAQ